MKKWNISQIILGQIFEIPLFGLLARVFVQNASILSQNARQKSKKRKFKNLCLIYLLTHFIFHISPSLLKSVEKWRSLTILIDKIFRKKFYEAKIPNACGRSSKIFFLQKLKFICLTIILRPKWAKLGLKWSFGEFSKSKHANNEIRLDPPPLKIH